MDEAKTPSKFDLRFAELKVVFVICDCSLDKRFSFYKLNREQAKRFLVRLQRIEKLSWAQFAALPREIGITPETPESAGFAMIHEQNTSANKLVEQYYFHFRVEPDGKFRVFGYQREHYFSITHIDYGHEIYRQ